MQFRCLPATSASPLGNWSGDTLVLGLFAGDDGQPFLGALEALLGAGVRQRLEQRAFKAKPAEVLALEGLAQEALGGPDDALVSYRRAREQGDASPQTAARIAALSTTAGITTSSVR